MVICVEKSPIHDSRPILNGENCLTIMKLFTLNSSLYSGLWLRFNKRMKFPIKQWTGCDHRFICFHFKTAPWSTVDNTVTQFQVRAIEFAVNKIYYLTVNIFFFTRYWFQRRWRVNFDGQQRKSCTRSVVSSASLASAGHLSNNEPLLKYSRLLRAIYLVDPRRFVSSIPPANLSALQYNIDQIFLTKY